MQIILLGCPGAGKGTQAAIISKHFNTPHISTGDILRAAIKQGSELGKKVQAIVDQGQLVPDALIIDIVKERLKQPDCQQGFLLDGFPRTVAQAEALESSVVVDYVIDIDVAKEDVVKRLSGRRVHEPSGRSYHIDFNPPKNEGVDDETGERLTQRPDDTETTVLHRLSVYQNQTQPLIEFYKTKQGKTPQYMRIDGSGSVEEISKQILTALQA